MEVTWLRVALFVGGDAVGGHEEEAAGGGDGEEDGVAAAAKEDWESDRVVRAWGLSGWDDGLLEERHCV